MVVIKNYWHSANIIAANLVRYGSVPFSVNSKVLLGTAACAAAPNNKNRYDSSEAITTNHERAMRFNFHFSCQLFVQCAHYMHM